MAWGQTTEVPISRHDREVLECLRDGWLKADMPLYGGLCYQDVLDLLEKLEVSTTSIEETIGVWETKIKEMRESGKIT